MVAWAAASCAVRPSCSAATGERPLDESEVARIAELAAAGLIGIDRASQTVQPLPAYDDWLALAIPDRWRRLLAAWRARACARSRPACW